jgi:hypothetical protein
MVPQVHVTRKSSGPTGRVLKGPAGTHRTEKGPIEDFYDELQASRMSNYRSHRYTLDRRIAQVHVARRKDRVETFMTNYKRHGCVVAGPTGTR